ncbi:hypothetical protein RI129_004816 [Pyrocoelia pectoralis]|uniref:Gustatory receptor n=1 Tax=Pyrocoelia pectoralis TaxID=417401 RepID=A0AAN7ZJR7_9COLE
MQRCIIKKICKYFNKYTKFNKTTHECFAFSLFIGQCFSLFPVYGITKSDVQCLHFKWFSYKVIYNCTFLFGVLVLIAFYIYHVSTSPEKFKFGHLVSIFFFSCAFLSTGLFLRLCPRWPKLMKIWTKVDEQLQGFDLSKNLPFKLKLISIVVLLAALLEHILFLGSSILNVKHEGWTQFDVFLRKNFNYIFDHIHFSVWKGVLFMILNVLLTFAWTFNDLFLVIISTGLAARFQQVTAKLRVLKNSKATHNVVKSKEITSHPLSMHRSLSFMLSLFQCFGIMPIYGINNKNSRKIRFRWKSIRFIYSICNASAALVCAIFCCIQFTRTGIVLDKSATLTFYLCNFFGVLCFIRVAHNWGKLIQEWSIVENSMRNDYGFPPHLKSNFKIITLIVLVFAIVEHSFFILNALNSVWKCENQNAEIYFSFAFPQVFTTVSYAHWKAVLVETANILATFCWNFLDLFIILISFALAIRFKQLSKRIENTKMTHESFWKQVREDYDKLAVLCVNTDKQIGPLVTVSYVSNLMFICLQLYNSLKPRFGVIPTVYFFYSFGFLLARIFTVSMYAAWINDESREPLRFLQSIPSHLYNSEIDRFIQQIHTTPVGITGCQFFLVTRSFLLRVAGTIVTFELMLLQFGPILEKDFISESFSSSEINCT